MRRIADLARVNILAALLATLATVPLLFLFGRDGIVPALVAGAALSLLVSWLYSRRVAVAAPAVDFREFETQSLSLLKLGLAFMASALVSAASAYAIRLIVVRLDGVVAAGLYQAAWTLGGLYAGFILQAMGADFYPRLTAVCHDNEACNRLVNEQAQIDMLLAGPGLLATLTVAPLVVAAFYSSQFEEAVHILRWICLGMMLRIIAWPMGFIIVAREARLMFFLTDALAALVHVALAWWLMAWFGLTGAGAAFFGLYIWHGVLVYGLVRWMSGFRWSAANLRLMLVFAPAAGLVFAAFVALPFWPATGVGALLTLATGLYSLHSLLKLLPPDALPAVVRPWRPKAV